MKCFVCKKELESGKYILNTYLCRNFCSHECEQKYIEKRIGKAEPTTAEMQEWLVENKYDILLRKNKSMIYSCTLYFYDENSLKAIDRAGKTLSEAIKQAYEWAKRRR